MLSARLGTVHTRMNEMWCLALNKSGTSRHRCCPDHSHHVLESGKQRVSAADSLGLDQYFQVLESDTSLQSWLCPFYSLNLRFSN